jgi:hypothetical protein
VFGTKKWRVGGVVAAVTGWCVGSKKNFKILDFSARVPAQMIDFGLKAGCNLALTRAEQ